MTERPQNSKDLRSFYKRGNPSLDLIRSEKSGNPSLDSTGSVDSGLEYEATLPAKTSQETQTKLFPLTPSMVQTHICSNMSRSARETESLLQWVCIRAENDLKHMEHVKVTAGYQTDKPSEPVLLAMVKSNPEDVPNSFDTFSLTVRQEGQVSDEGKFISEKEKDMDFSPEEHEKIQKCISKHSKSLMAKHSNLEIVTSSKFKSKGYGTSNTKIIETNCIALYVHVKGIVPFNEDPFPTELDGFQVDVREGLFKEYTLPEGYVEKLMMGCQISSAYATFGSLGGFVGLQNGKIGCLTCWHVFLSERSKADLRQGNLSHKSFKREVFQPDDSSENLKFGIIKKEVFNPGDEVTVGVDAALIEITDSKRLPVGGHFPNATSDIAGFSLEHPMIYDSGQVFTNFAEVPKPCTVVKYGMKTGHTIGQLKLAGSAVHKRKYTYAIGENATEEYELFNQFEIFNIDSKPFSQPGDSGALVFVVTHHGETYDIRALGLLVGGTSNNTTIVTPIWAVLDQLGLPRRLLQFPNSSSNGATQTTNGATHSRIETDVALLKQNVSDLKEVTSAMDKKLDENTRTIGSVGNKLDDFRGSVENVNRKMEDVRTSVDCKIDNLQQVLLQAMLQNTKPNKSDTDSNDKIDRHSSPHSTKL